MQVLDITVPRSWSELTDWQLEEIAHLYLNTPIDGFSEAYEKMVLVAYRPDNSYTSARRLRKIAGQVPISRLAEETEWLLKTTNIFRFPDIEGLIKPAPALGDITIKQFSVIDTFFYAWHKDKSPLNLKRLVASIYRIKETFDEMDLPAVDAITRQLSPKKMEVIALVYLFTRMHIVERFPIVFPKKVETEEEKLKPVFTKKDADYVSFDKMIIGMSMDELQPLGKKQDANNVRIYEFLSVLSESIIYHRNKAKANER